MMSGSKFSVFSVRFNDKDEDEDQKSFNKEEKSRFFFFWLLNIMSCDWERDSISSVFPSQTGLASHKPNEWHMRVGVYVCGFSSYSYFFLVFFFFCVIFVCVCVLPFIIVVMRLFAWKKVKTDEVFLINIYKDRKPVLWSKVHGLWKKMKKKTSTIVHL